MMKNRTVGILLGAILLLGLVAILADKTERARRSPASSGRIVAGFEAAKAVKFEIVQKDRTTTLEKKDGVWKLAPEGFDADEAAVKEALDKLERAEKAEVAAENPEKHAAMEVKQGDDKSLLVRAWTAASGDPQVRLWVGKTAGDFNSTFVRLDGEDRVWRVREALRAAFDRPRGWRDRTILKFTPEDAVRLELQGEEGRFVFERDAEKDSTWRFTEPEPGPANHASVDGIARALSNLQADEFPSSSDPVACGVAEPKATTKVVLKDGRTFELLWGGEAPNSRIFLKRADAATVWEVSSWRKNQAFPKLEVLRPAPSPAPSPTSSPSPSPTPGPAASPSPAPAAAAASPAAPAATPGQK